MISQDPWLVAQASYFFAGSSWPPQLRTQKTLKLVRSRQFLGPRLPRMRDVRRRRLHGQARSGVHDADITYTMARQTELVGRHIGQKTAPRMRYAKGNGHGSSPAWEYSRSSIKIVSGSL